MLSNSYCGVPESLLCIQWSSLPEEPVRHALISVFGGCFLSPLFFQKCGHASGCLSTIRSRRRGGRIIHICVLSPDETSPCLRLSDTHSQLCFPVVSNALASRRYRHFQGNADRAYGALLPCVAEPFAKRKPLEAPTRKLGLPSFQQSTNRAYRNFFMSILIIFHVSSSEL